MVTSVLLKEVVMNDRELQFVQLVGADSRVIPEIEPGSALAVQREKRKIDLMFVDYKILGLCASMCMTMLRELRPNVPVLAVLKENERIDLIFIDYEMRGLDISSRMRILRGLRPGVPVIVLTQRVNPDRYLKTKSLGAIESMNRQVTLAHG